MPPKKSSAKSKLPKASRPQIPGYGLAPAKKGLLPWSWAEQRLARTVNYWITTVRPEGAPHTMVVWGVWLDGCFLFSTGAETVKARNLAANPRCIVCNDNSGEAVIVEGIAEIAGLPERKKFISPYEKKYKWDLSSMKDDMLSMKQPVFAVRPKTVFGLWEKRFTEKSTRWQFE